MRTRCGRIIRWGMPLLLAAALAALWITAVSAPGDFVTPTDLEAEAVCTLEPSEDGTCQVTLDRDQYALLVLNPVYAGEWTFASSGPTEGGGDPWIEIYDALGVSQAEENIGYMPATVTLTPGQTWRAALRVDWSMSGSEPLDGQTFTLTVTHEDMGGVCGPEAVWNLEGDTLRITGSGPMDDFGYYASPWYDYGSRIARAEVGEGITTLGAYAFHGCFPQEVSLPATLTSLGKNAFAESQLQRVVIPEGVTAIPSGAFKYCSALTEVTLPASVTSIASDAFSGSTGVTVRCLAGSYALEHCRAKGLRYEIIPFPNTLTLPEDTAEIGSEAFAGLEGPVNVAVPAGVTALPEDVLRGTTVLLILPEGSPLWQWAEEMGIEAIAGEQ